MSMFSRARRLVTLTCEDVNAFLVAYHDDALDPRIRTRFERHVERCACCRSYLAQYDQTIALVEEGGRPDPPGELVDLTLAFLREHCGTGADGRRGDRRGDREDDGDGRDA